MTDTYGDRLAAADPTDGAPSAPPSALPQPRGPVSWVDRIVAAVTPRAESTGPSGHSARPVSHTELRARNDRAATAFRAGRYADAERGFAVVLSHARRTLGEDHPDTLVTAGNLAAARVRAGHPGQAVALLEHAVDARTRVWGPAHPATLDVRNALGVALFEAGDPGAAATLRAVLADRTECLGITHPDTEDTREVLARAVARERETSPTHAVAPWT